MENRGAGVLALGGGGVPLVWVWRVYGKKTGCCI